MVKGGIMKKFFATLAVLAIMVMLIPTSGHDAVAADYYKGKTIELVVAGEAGSGTDIVARVVAKHLGKFIPGKPTVIVNNMPGGGATVGANYVYDIAKPDGLTMLYGMGKTAMGSLIRVKGAKFDYTQMIPVMAIPFGAVGYASTKLIKKPEDITTASGVIAGASSLPSMVTTYLLLASEVLDFKPAKVITAYRGSGDSRLAFMNGEINYSSETAAGYRKAVVPLVKKGQAIPVWSSGLIDEDGKVIREPALREVPTVEELYRKIYGKNPSGSAWKAYRMITSVVANMSKVILFRKGAEEYAEIVAKACEEMAQDPGFSKDKEKLARGNPIFLGKQLKNLWQVSINETKPDVIKWVRNWLKEGYDVALEP